MERFEYPVLFKRAKEGGYVVTCRDLPQLITQGDTLTESIAASVDAMDEVFAAYMQRGLAFPVPSPIQRGERMISPPAETVAKAALYVSMRKSGVNKVQLAQRLGVDEKEVRRLLDPHHGSKLPRIAQAVQALGGRLVIGLESA